MQRQALSGHEDRSGGARLPPSVRSVLGAGGEPLPAGTRHEMEHGFGHDFSRVRVHAASTAAADVGARAFTVGAHVVFGPGNYAPHTDSGRRLLAHELAHVVQQRDAGAVDLDRLPIDTDAHGPVERAADAAAAAALSRSGGDAPSPSLAAAPAPVLSRQPLPGAGLDSQPQSLHGTLVLDESALSDQALDLEIARLAAWVDAHPFDSRLGHLLNELERLRVEQLARPGRRREAQTAKKESDQAARIERTRKRFTRLSEEAASRQYTKGLAESADDSSDWGRTYDLETMEGVAEERFPGAAWLDRRTYRELSSGAKWPWYQRRQMETLKAKVKDWTAPEQALARDLLWQWLEWRNTGKSQKEVKDAIIALVVKQYEVWMRAVQDQRAKKCADPSRGFLQRQHDRGNNDDPCRSWFENDSAHGPSELHSIESYMRVTTPDDDVAPLTAVYYFVQEFRNRTNAKQLQMAADASEMLSGFAMAAQPGGRMPPPGLGLDVPITRRPPTPVQSDVVTPAPAQPPRPQITAHAEPGSVVIKDVKPPAVVDTVRTGSTPKAAPPPAPSKVDATKTGRRIVVTPDPPANAPPVKQGGDNPKTPQAPTAKPTSDPNVAPEGFGDVLDQPGVQVTKTPGGAQQNVKTETGNFTHKMIEILQNNPQVMERLQREGGSGIFSAKLPPDLVPEFTLVDPADPGPPRRIDRLWRGGDTIFEIKPNTDEAIRGEAQAQWYAKWMDEHHPRPGGKKWYWEVVTYDQEAMIKFLRRIGFLPPEPPPPKKKN